MRAKNDSVARINSATNRLFRIDPIHPPPTKPTMATASTTNPSATTATATPVVVVGVDLGTLSSKVTLLLNDAPTTSTSTYTSTSTQQQHEIVRNAHGGHDMPTAVTFFSSSGYHRGIGEDATDWYKGDENTVWGIGRLVLLSSVAATASGGGEGGGTEDASPDAVDASTDFLAPFRRFQQQLLVSNSSSSDDAAVHIPIMGQSYSPASLLAMVLGRIERNVLDTLHRLLSGGSISNSTAPEGGKDVSIPIHFVFVTPPPPPQLSPLPLRRTIERAFQDATYAGTTSSSSSSSSCAVIDSSTCIASILKKKYNDAAAASARRGIEDEEGDEDYAERTILVVEMGHAITTITLLRRQPRKMGDAMQDFVKKYASMGTEVTVTSLDASTPERRCPATAIGGMFDVEILSSMSHWNLGAACIDVALYHHFMKTHPSLSRPTTTAVPGGSGSDNTLFACNSKKGQRLLEGCRKLKHMLSMLPSSTVTVENVGVNDSDVVLACNRDVLRELCESEDDGVLSKLRCLIASAMDKAGGVEVDEVEVTGGGCRIPMIQEVIRSVCKKGGEYVLGQSLDDTALAFGASSFGVGVVRGEGTDDVNMLDATRVAQREQLRQLEHDMAAQDRQYQLKAEIKNFIEAHILELRSARHDTKLGSLLPSSSNEEFTSHLDDTDDWLFSEACDSATVTEMEERWVAIQSKTKELCAEYLVAKQAEIDQKNREMEEEVKRAAALRDAEYAMSGGPNDDMEDQEDHDTRRLPTKRRMEIVLKNKNEANELFADGNYRHAAARYVKALTHCGKFFDLSPVEEKEVIEMKLSLYLNVALAYIKLEKFDNAYQYCNDALSLDSNNVKALYRRASVLYQKRKFDDAMKDCVEAGKLAPEDKAVKKLEALVEQQIAKQKQKEKAMAKKMFG